MATHSANGLVYIIEIEQQHLDYLGQIRHWTNAKIATDKNTYWIKDLTTNQINSLEIKSIPFKMIYKLIDQKLFLLDGLLPVKKMPSSLLWTPLEKGLPLSLPAYNFNYFGLEQQLSIKLVATENEQQAFAILSSLETLAAYINTVAAIRLKPLSWIIIEKEALIFGTPILPIQGKTFWKRNNTLLPTGYDFEFHLLATLMEKKINDNNSYILWNEDASYLSIDKNAVKPLSLSSFRLTLNKVLQ